MNWPINSFETFWYNMILFGNFCRSKWKMSPKIVLFRIFPQWCLWELSSCWSWQLLACWYYCSQVLACSMNENLIPNFVPKIVLFRIFPQRCLWELSSCWSSQARMLELATARMLMLASARMLKPDRVLICLCMGSWGCSEKTFLNNHRHHHWWLSGWVRS